MKKKLKSIKHILVATIIFLAAITQIEVQAQWDDIQSINIEGVFEKSEKPIVSLNNERTPFSEEKGRPQYAPPEGDAQKEIEPLPVHEDLWILTGLAVACSIAYRKLKRNFKREGAKDIIEFIFNKIYIR